MPNQSRLKHHHSKPIFETLEERQLFSAGLESLLTEQVQDPNATYVNEDAAPLPTAETQSEPVLMLDSQAQRNEIVFVDTSVEGYQTLIDDILGNASDSSNIEVIELDDSKEGIAQITDILAGSENLDAIHIISHGSDGSIDLGNSQLNFDTLIQNQQDISAWGNAFNESGDILLYGCNVAETQFGQSFVEYLANITNTDVAASVDATGQAALGGDWQLEFQTAAIETQVAVSADGQSEWQGLMAVTSNGVASSSSTDNATSLAWTHTVSDGVNRALFVEVAIDGLGAYVTGVTYGGVALVQVGRSGGNHAVEIWALVAPTVGTAEVVVSFAGSTAAAAGATTFNGVDQSTPYGTYNGASGMGLTASTTVASATGDLVIDVQYWSFWGLDFVGAGQTRQWQEGSLNMMGSSSTEAGAASVTMSNTVISLAQWEIGAVSIKAAGVNTAPVLTSNTGTLSYPENTGPYLIGGSATITDADAGNFEGGQLSVQLTVNGQAEDRLTIRNEGTGAGQVGVSGNTISYGGVIVGTFNGPVTASTALVVTFNANSTASIAQAVLRNLTYENTSEDPSILTRTITASVTDGDGGTSNTVTSYIAPTKVNDAPVNILPTNTYTAVNTAKTFSSANNNALQISDVDAGTGELQITLSVSQGTLTLASTAGLTLVSGANGSGSMTYTGTVSAINAALNAGLTFTPNGDYRGLAHLSILTSDQGNTGGGTLSDTDTLAIHVGAIVVTNASDILSAGANTSSIQALIASDGGDGISLREAIMATNNSAGTDYIYFNISGTGVHTIDLTSALPAITGKVIIDASTDDSYAANSSRPAIVLNGGGIVTDGIGLYAGSDGSTIRGFVMQNFTGNAISIGNSNGNTIAGNWIGLTADGSGAAGNTAGIGIWNSANNIIGGSTVADRNVISGNLNVGIGIGSDNGTSTGNQIKGNYIGTDVTGAYAVGNANQGIWVNAAGNIIGGSLAGEGNVISGTLNWVGIQLESPAANTLVAGNLIGLNATGTAALANAGGGIFVQSANNTIGGTTATARNVISGNGGNGITLNGSSATGNNVIGNYIGVGADGTTALGNAIRGVAIENAASNNVIGGTQAGAGNIIANNDVGISVLDSSAGNVFLQNSIYSNIGLGIDLGDDGVTSNDAGDVDSGPNSLLNSVELTRAVVNITNLTLSAIYSGAANTYYRFEIFSDTTASGEGRMFLAAVNLSVGSSGTINFNVNFSDASLAVGQYITVTATRTDSNNSTFYETSEFSNTVVTSSPDSAPIGQDGTISVTEDTAYTFTVADFAFTDADGNNLDQVIIESLPGSGTLYLNGVAVNELDGISVADINAGLLTYVPAGNINGIGVSSFLFSVIDDGSTYGGGQTMDQTPNTLTIDIGAVNDAPVVTSGDTANVDENSATSTVVYTASGSDADGNGLSWSLSGADAALLSIDASTGAVTLNTAADYESKTSYSFNIVASDGTLSSSQAVTLSVGNLNDNPVSAVSDSNVTGNSVNENAATGTAVGITATASDADAGTTISYSLSDNAGGRFAIDSSTGVVTVADGSLLDYEQATSHSITVLASSSDGSSNSQSFTINVGNLNDNPVSAISDSDASANTIVENASNGALVGITALATDADTGATISYSLSDDAGGRFAIDSTTGVVTVADGSLLDYEQATSHSITVLASSSDGSSNSQSFTINVGNLNDNPVSAVSDSDASGNSVNENAATGTVVAITATASDADVGTTISYSLSDDAGGRFAIDSTTGVVTVADGSLLDYEQASSHSITVLASSSDGSSNSQSFTINVGNLNDNPVSAVSDSDVSGNSVNENAATGTVVATTATASDADAGTTISYSLSDNAGGRFAIDSSTGVVTVADGSLLDYEQATSHSITVLASSSDGSSNSQSFTINVGNLNDNPVSAISDSDASANTIVENASNGALVGITALATDADTGATISYSLSDDAGGRFAIDSTTGVVTVADGSLLDYEQATSHSITVLASSSDGSSNSQSFSINVGNLNDNPVSAVSDSDASGNSVNENAVTGTVVGITATASDADAGTTISYSLSDNAGGRFAIDSTTGVVTVADGSLLDYEQATSHSITVLASSSDGSSNSQSFTINVGNLNDNPVSAVSDSDVSGNSVNENAATGTVVATTATASDADAGTTISYSLSDNAGGRFAIDSSTGVVTVADGSLLDYEQATSHSITVLASSSDGSSNSQSFSINVGNLNDNAPVISSGGSASVTENSATSTVVYAASGSDADGNSLSWSLSGADAALLNIDANSGEVTLNTAANYESKTSYSFNVVVNDGVHSSSQAVTLSVNDLNDGTVPVSPTFIPMPDNGSPGTKINGVTDTGSVDTSNSDSSDTSDFDETEELIVDLNAYVDKLISIDRKRLGAIDDNASFSQVQEGRTIHKNSFSYLYQNGNSNDKSDVKRRFLNVESRLGAGYQVIDSEYILTESEENEFWSNLERMSVRMNHPDVVAEAKPVDIKIVLGASVGLTAGFVSWVLRAGSLMASFMSTVPLLRRFDPLPILKFARKQEQENIAPNLKQEESESESID